MERREKFSPIGACFRTRWGAIALSLLVLALLGSVGAAVVTGPAGLSGTGTAAPSHVSTVAPASPGSGTSAVGGVLIPLRSASIWGNPNPAGTGATVSFDVNYTPPSGGGCNSNQPDFCIFSLNYGDGSAPGVSACISTTNKHTFTHAYTRAGSYTVGATGSSYVDEYSGSCTGTLLYNTSLTQITEVVGMVAGAITPASPGIDVGGSVTLTSHASGGTAPYTYHWFTGASCATVIAGATSATYVAAPASTTTYSYNATDSSGPPPSRECSPADPVTVNALPTLAPTATPAAADAGVSISFDAGITGGTAPYTTTWRFDDGTTGSGTPAAHAYTTSGTYKVHVFVNDSSIGHAQGNVTVTIYPALVSSPHVHPLTIDAGMTAYFFENVSGGHAPVSWEWTFGNGGRTATGNTSHVYASAGTFPAIFWANDSGSTADHTWFNITVNAVPSTALSATYNTVDAGTADKLLETVSGGSAPFSYAWRFGDGTGASGSANPSHTYAAAGSYTARAWANDSLGDVATGTLTITVSPALTVALSAGHAATDIGVLDTLYSNTTGGTAPVSIAWVLGDHSVGSGSPLSHAYAAAGTYTVHCWVNDTGGGAWAGTVVITVNGAPTVAATVSLDPVDQGVADAFTSSGSGGTGGLSYAWTFGDGGTSAMADPSHTFTAPGTFTVRVWANDTVGGTISALLTVTVDPPLVVHLTPLHSWLDEGMTDRFVTSSTGGTSPETYNWSFGDSTTGTGSGLSHTYATVGSYTVTLWINDSGGGRLVAFAQVTVNPDLTVVSWAASHPHVDVGHMTVLSVTAAGGNGSQQYSYSGLPIGCSDENTEPLDCTPTTAGTYTVTVVVSDGLMQVTSTPLTVVVGSDPTISGFRIAPSPVTEDRTISISVTVSGGTTPVNLSYQGLPTGCSGTTASFACVPTVSGTFTVEAIATDTVGATAFKNVTLLVNPAPTISSFNATPDSVTLGSGLSLTVVASGGTGALSYTYSGLPAGCASQDTDLLACLPNTTGTFTVKVTVMDPSGVSANATATLTVVASSHASSGLGGSLSGTTLALLLAVVAVIVVGALAGILYWRRRTPPKETAEAASVPPGAPTPPTGETAPSPYALPAESADGGAGWSPAPTPEGSTPPPTEDLQSVSYPGPAEPSAAWPPPSEGIPPEGSEMAPLVLPPPGPETGPSMPGPPPVGSFEASPGPSAPSPEAGPTSTAESPAPSPSAVPADTATPPEGTPPPRPLPRGLDPAEWLAEK